MANRYMLNLDGSLHNQVVGYGDIIRDPEGNPLFAATGNTTPSSISVHELQKLDICLNVALNHDLKHVECGVDSMLVMDIIQNHTEPPWFTLNLHLIWLEKLDS